MRWILVWGNIQYRSLMYQNLYDAIHAKSGQPGPLKMQCVRTDKETDGLGEASIATVTDLDQVLMKSSQNSKTWSATLSPKHERKSLTDAI